MSTTDLPTLLLPLLLAGISPAQTEAPQAPGGAPPKILAMPDGMRVVLLERPTAGLACLATFTAAGRACQAPGEEGITAVLARESLTGTTGLGGPGWAEEKRLQVERERLLLAALKARLEGRSLGEEEKRRLAETTDRLDRLTAPRAWPARLEEEGGCGLRTGSGPRGFSLAAALPAERAGRWFAFEAARLRAPALRTLLDTSRRSRRAEGVQWRRDPRRRALAALLQLAFRRHPLRDWLSPPPPGPIRWTRARRFWRREVRPRRTVIALVGSWPEELGPICRALFQPAPDARPPALEPPSEPPQEGARREETLPGDPPGAWLGWRIPPGTDPAVLLVLADLLGNSRAGYLSAFLARDMGSLSRAEVLAPFPCPGEPALFVIGAAPRPGGKGLQAARTVIGHLSSWRPREGETTRARHRVVAALRRRRASPLDLALGLARAEAAGEGARAWLELPRRVAAVAGEEVEKPAATLFQESRLNRVVTGPSGEE